MQSATKQYKLFYLKENCLFTDAWRAFSKNLSHLSKIVLLDSKLGLFSSVRAYAENVGGNFICSPMVILDKKANAEIESRTWYASPFGVIYCATNQEALGPFTNFYELQSRPFGKIEESILADAIRSLERSLVLCPDKDQPTFRWCFSHDADCFVLADEDSKDSRISRQHHDILS